jgi:hypothetical protein
VRTLALALLSLAGCIDEFHGSNVQIDLATPTPAQVSAGLSPAANELPSNIHFTLYAFDEYTTEQGTTVGSLFEIQQFEIHHAVDLASPCYIDVGEHVPFPGIHVSQYVERVKMANGIDDIANPPASATEQQKIEVATAIQRGQNIDKLAAADGPKALTSVSDVVYPPVAASCTDPDGIPPPMCSDDDSNARRLAACQGIWSGDRNLYEGTDRVLTLPLNGAVAGFVSGLNPINLGAIGGAQFFVDEALDDFDGYAIYWQYDDANHDGMPDYPASIPMSDRNVIGKQFLFGRPEAPTRGVIHVRMTNLTNPLITADLAVFADLDTDDVHF